MEGSSSNNEEESPPSAAGGSSSPGPAGRRWTCEACGCNTNSESDRSCTICGTSQNNGTFVRSCVCMCVCVCEDDIDLIPRCVCLGSLSVPLSFQPNQPKLLYHLSVVSVVLSILQNKSSLSS
jgi:hypothetical protein